MGRPAPRRRRGRILFSILLLLFAVGVVPLAYVSWDLVSRSRESIESTQQEWQLDKARLISTQVAIYVAGLRSQVTSIARTLEIDASTGNFTALIERITREKSLARYFQTSDSLVFLGVVDPTCYGAKSGLDLRDPRLREQVEEACQRVQHGSSMISVPIVAESLQEPVIVLGEPVLSAGKVAGGVLAVASLQPIRQITTSTAGQIITAIGRRQFEVYVIDNRGRLIAHSEPKHPLSADMSGIEIVRLFLNASEDLTGKGARGRRSGAWGTTLFETVDEKGRARRMLGTYMPIPDDSGWGVIVQSDTKYAYFTAIELREKSLTVAGLVAALAVVLGFLFAGEISRPVQKLAEGARRLAAGDYATRVTVRSGNEVGTLADAFNQMGEEIQKAILEIERRAEENKDLFMGSIRMLANAIDEKDPYTRGHSERVAYYAACIAKHLGMTAEEVERVHLSGIIHDVGKIGIEDKILRKAAALTEEEYTIMKQHPTKGEHILEAVPLLKDKAGDGLMHHENVDGSGYPRGLRGEAIPLFGRIVSVGDAFDAMTTDRPYSKAWTFEAAIDRLKLLAGKKFDVDCVAAFERAFLSGDVTPAKAHRASVASRHFDLNALFGDEPSSAMPEGQAAPSVPV